MNRKVVFQWAVSSYFGWGVYGLNLAINGRRPGVTLATASGINPQRINVDAARLWVLQDFLRVSQILSNDLSSRTGRVNADNCTALHAFGNNFDFAVLGYNNTCLMGDRNIAVIFFEDTRMDAKARARAKDYEMIIAGSSWNGEVLRAKGFKNVKVVLQGVDPTLFHPAPRADLFRDRFAIFSGGKLEYRKGQDLVLKAFKIFHQRHPEAILLTAWHSPWSAMVAESMAKVPGIAPVPLGTDGAVDVKGWVVANGLPADSVIDLGAMPNALMPPVLREADVALFTNRCEGGTNLVAMEAMACGVPTILSANTGHLDLMEPANCFPLTRQTPIVSSAGMGTEGWGESDVDEIVENLEIVYADRAAARARGAAGAATLSRLSWQAQIDALMTAIA